MRTELHRHLDASLRPTTLLELAREFHIDVPFENAQDIRDRFWITEQMSSLKEVLDCFVLFQKVLGSEAALERVAFEAVEDAFAEGITHLELRFSPSFACELSNVPWVNALEAFERGIRRGSEKTGVKVGLICIVSRGFGLQAALETMEFAVEHAHRLIGVDLAGLEDGYPCRQYAKVFKLAHDAKLPVTVHAGEACGAENVWEAIDLLGARRIGHGIHSIEDPELLKRLAKDKILLETCPTSNFITRSVASWTDHPLPRLLEAGVPVSVSTDDPGIFGVSLPEEYARCKKYLGLTDFDLIKIDEYAYSHSFLKNR